MEATIVAIVLFLWGAGTSYFQERFGSYENLSSQLKQLINAVVNLIVPAIVAWVQPYWKVEFGNPEEFFVSLLLFLSPLAVWLFSQLAHQVDKRLGL